MSARVFVDTTVFVYARESGDPAKQASAREWLELLWRGLRGRTSIQVLNEYYAVITQQARFEVSRDEAWSDVSELLEWKPQEVDREIFTRAFEIQSRYQLNWWDCLIVASAQAQDCILLLTEDLQDGADYGGIIVRSPFTLRVAEEAGAYTLPPRVVSRHRGRGRPRAKRAPAAA
jgi:predicted nucleic acid-binding protein